MLVVAIDAVKLSWMGMNGDRSYLNLNKQELESMYWSIISGSMIKTLRVSVLERMWEEDQSFMIRFKLCFNKHFVTVDELKKMSCDATVLLAYISGVEAICSNTSLYIFGFGFNL
ncbi:hypothetical protein DM860_003180 [Cuscuta australis]|uniref:Uncharacterized protein n=1 Tax=Cuscuta australis TaxID=267555 RepID=A0A328D1K3_9ASTE|nr:hypothetical protein DM860_003180 [Cuscuta australis]